MSFYLPHNEKKQLKTVGFAAVLFLVGICICIALISIAHSRKKSSQMINTFITEIKENPQEDVFGVIDKLRILKTQVSFRSNMDEAEDLVLDIVKSEIENRHNNTDRSETFYRSMLNLAEKICAVDEEHKSNHFRKTSVYQFAQSFRQLMNIVQNGQCQLNINEIKVRSTYDDGACIGDCSCKTGSSQPVQLVKEVKTISHLFKKETNLPGFTPPAKIICKPWDTLSVSLYIWEFDESPGIFGDSWDKKGQKVFSFVPARHSGVFKDVDLSHVFMTIHYSLNYKTFDALYSECFQ